MAKYTSKYDALYEKYVPDVPVLYLRTLAAYESGSNPKSRPAHGHWGLLQVGQAVLADYNKRHGTDHRLIDVLDPALNIKMYGEWYRMLLRVYRGIVSRIGRLKAKNFIEDWANPEFALMVTAGWNSGLGAVKKTVAQMDTASFPLGPVLPVGTITHVDLFDVGRKSSSGKMRKLFSLKKQVWQNKLVGAFRGLKGMAKRGVPLIKMPSKKFAIDWKILLLVLLLFSRRRRA